MDELLLDIFAALISKKTQCDHKTGRTLSLVNKRWYEYAAKVKEFWTFTIGYLPETVIPGVPFYNRFLWTNQVVLVEPSPCDCLAQSLDLCLTQTLSKLRLDKSLMHFGTFERLADKKYQKVSSVPLGEYLSDWDEGAIGGWINLRIHIDLRIPLEVKKGHFVGLLYEDEVHEFQGEGQQYWPHIAFSTNPAYGRTWLMHFDHNKVKDEMEGSEAITDTGWVVNLTGPGKQRWNKI